MLLWEGPGAQQCARPGCRPSWPPSFSACFPFLWDVLSWGNGPWGGMAITDCPFSSSHRARRRRCLGKATL